VRSLGSPPLTRPSASRRRYKYAVREERGRSNLTVQQNNNMDNQPSFAERTARLKETALQLRTAADVVLQEVQHMEAAQARFAQKAHERKGKNARA
jgi:hypothetical protein